MDELNVSEIMDIVTIQKCTFQSETTVEVED